MSGPGQQRSLDTVTTNADSGLHHRPLLSTSYSDNAANRNKFQAIRDMQENIFQLQCKQFPDQRENLSKCSYEEIVASFELKQENSDHLFESLQKVATMLEEIEHPSHNAF
uniref:Uncharacterized protein n=1 Tax=Spongospora subterranea TaxID=70186 RepID=A0A0H5REU0_9EUKA|eukprot:CRZ12047.1 hypothetical protein [Spongospora subterranea]